MLIKIYYGAKGGKKHPLILDYLEKLSFLPNCIGIAQKRSSLEQHSIFTPIYN